MTEYTKLDNMKDPEAALIESAPVNIQSRKPRLRPILKIIAVIFTIIGVIAGGMAFPISLIYPDKLSAKNDFEKQVWSVTNCYVYDSQIQATTIGCGQDCVKNTWVPIWNVEIAKPYRNSSIQGYYYNYYVGAEDQINRYKIGENYSCYYESYNQYATWYDEDSFNYHTFYVFKYLLIGTVCGIIVGLIGCTMCCWLRIW